MKNIKKKGRNAMKKAKRIIVAVTLLIAAAFLMNSNKLPAGNVQAASASSMKKAYKRYLANNVSGKKYFKVVNIGDRNKPVLLIGTYKGYGKGSYTGCKVYYYKGGKVRKVGSLSAGRGIDLYTKKGQNYINSGLSDETLFLCVKDGKSYVCEYYNSHSWRIYSEDKFEKCVIRKGGKIIKNYGYMDSTQYNRIKNSYKYKKTVRFIKNTAANRRKI